MKIVFTVLFPILAYFTVFSQTQNCVVGLNTGETMEGFLTIPQPFDGRNSLHLKQGDGSLTEVHPSEVHSITTFQGSDSTKIVSKVYHRPKNDELMKGFMRVLVSGQVELLEFTYSPIADLHEDDPMRELFPTELTDLYLEKEDSLTLVKEVGFSSAMAKYFSDNVSLSTSIDDGQLKYENLQRIVEIYNDKDRVNLEFQGYVAGEVYTLLGDTLMGWIKLTDKYSSGTDIIYKNEKGVDIILDYATVVGYKRGKELYVVRGEEKRMGQPAYPRFMKYLIMGDVSLLEYSRIAVTDGYMSGAGPGMAPILIPGGVYEEKTTYFFEKHGELTQLKGPRFKKFVSEYFHDCPELIEKVNNKELNIDDTPKIVTYYNNFKREQFFKELLDE